MPGTATEIRMCGTTIRLGDEMRVEYTTGERMKGAIISGRVVELWSQEKDNHLQARLSCGWCFHDHDKILSHRPISETLVGRTDRGDEFTELVSFDQAMACLSGHWNGDMPAIESLLRNGAASSPNATYRLVGHK